MHLYIHVMQILKPAFTILVDHKTKYFFLLIRGTHSIKDTLTAATGAVVPFHHSVVHEGGVSNLVLGYAHCGMVAAAWWISKLATPCLKQALGQFPDYKLKVNASWKLFFPSLCAQFILWPCHKTRIISVSISKNKKKPQIATILNLNLI